MLCSINKCVYICITKEIIMITKAKIKENNFITKYMKTNIEPLIVGGKYNRREVMRRAWAYFSNPFCTQYRNNFKGAVRAAWTDAKVAMDEERYSLVFAKRDMSELYSSSDMKMGYATR